MILKMSSEKFEALEDDLTSIIDDITIRVNKKIPSYAGEDRKSAIRQVERKLEEANLVVKDMDSHARIAPVSYRTQLMGKVRNYKRDLEHLSSGLKRGSSGAAGADNAGFDREDRMQASQRSKLIQGKQSLNRTSESIARSQQISSETDAIATEIIADLGEQRDVLDRTRERLGDTDANLIKARKTLRGMARKVMTNKMILAVIILLELGGVGVAVYLKFFS